MKKRNEGGVSVSKNKIHWIHRTTALLYGGFFLLMSISSLKSIHKPAEIDLTSMKLDS